MSDTTKIRIFHASEQSLHTVLLVGVVPPGECLVVKFADHQAEVDKLRAQFNAIADERVGPAIAEVAARVFAEVVAKTMREKANPLQTLSAGEKQLLSGVANGLGMTYQRLAEDLADSHPFTEPLSLTSARGIPLRLEFDPAEGQSMWLESGCRTGESEEDVIRIDTIENAEAIAQHLLGWVRAERARRVTASPAVCKDCESKLGHDDDAWDQCRFCNAGKPSDEANTSGAAMGKPE